MARHRRWVAGAVFAAVTTVACLLLGRLLTGSSWPLAHARMLGARAILSKRDVAAIERGLARVRREIESGRFRWSAEDEDSE